MNALVRFSGELSGIEQMARLGNWQPGTVLMAIWGYFDESGEHDPVTGFLKRLTLGGFYAPWGATEALIREWRRALEEECLTASHLKEWASDEDNYLNWPDEKKRRYNRFLAVLCAHVTHFAAFSYPVLNPRRAFVQAYKPALARSLIELEQLCIAENERGHIVFAQTDEISNAMIGRYFDGANWNNHFDGYAVHRAANEPALQAAEIVARAMKRFMQDGGITYSHTKIKLTGKPIIVWPREPAAAVGETPYFAWRRK